MQLILTLILLFTSPMVLSVCESECFRISTYDKIWSQEYDNRIEREQLRRDVDELKTDQFEKEIRIYSEPYDDTHDMIDRYY